MEELTSSVTTLSFEEREQKALAAIQEVEADIRLAELEERLQCLKLQRDEIRRGDAAIRKRGLTMRSPRWLQLHSEEQGNTAPQRR